MFSYLARMTKSVIYFITSNKGFISEHVEGGWCRMAETVMPCGGRNEDAGVGGGCFWSWQDGVEVAGTIVSKHHTSSRDNFNRKIECIRFYRTIVVTSELLNGEEVVNERWDNKNIIQS